MLTLQISLKDIAGVIPRALSVHLEGTFISSSTSKPQPGKLKHPDMQRWRRLLGTLAKLDRQWHVRINSSSLFKVKIHQPPDEKTS